MNVQKVLLIEGLANIIVMVIKLVIGIKTGSAAILGDAMHSLSDVTNNIIAFLTARIAGQPPDREHPYGHHKFEQLAVFGLAMLLAIIAFELMLNAIRRFGQPVEQSIICLLLMICVLLVNIGITTWEHVWAKRLNSDLLKADARHTLVDVLTTITVLIGWQLSVYGFFGMDSVFAILVAGLIFYLAYDLFRKAVPILVDSVSHDPQLLIKALNRLPAVREVRRVRSRSVGIETVADVVISVDGGLSTKQSHEVANAIEELLAKEFDIQDVTVHVEPAIK